jgi:hypothetical protein
MTPDDVRHATQWLANELRARPEDRYDYDQPSHGLAWSVWRTVEHVIDDLLVYALQVAGRAQAGYLPLVGADGGEVAHCDRSAGVLGLTATLEACGELLAAQVQAQPPTERAYHPYGESDPAGFAAMGVVEALVHGWDVLTALDDAVAELPEDLCAKVLDRLFPGSPRDLGSPQDVLLWQTGREELAGRGRLTTWRWDATVR